LERNWFSHWKRVKDAFNRCWPSIKPLFLFSLFNQVNILLEKAIASLIGPGSVAAVEYARLIPETSQVLLIVPLGLVSLSSMSTFQEQEVREHSDRISSMVILLLVPLSCFILISAPDIIRLLYSRGTFDETSIYLTSMTLRGMSIGMWAVSLAYVFQKIFNARIRNREVLQIGAAGIITNALFNVMTYKYLGILAIGLGSSLGGIITLWLYIRKMGSLKNFVQMGRICLFGLLPYCIIGLLIESSYDWTPLNRLLVQLLWAIISWSIVFRAFPSSRNTLKYLFEKLASLRSENR
ncbi:MAG: hypothetical protein OEU95_09580, partial [Nitrospirota bacterium]|nr:hypothetical protein [Nitrospirota bacterium]